MLILTRKHGETLYIGDEVKVKVLSVQHGEVSIGIDAPKDVPVHREEIYKRIQDTRIRIVPDCDDGVGKEQAKIPKT